ncbi:hypothetical protein IscW_ISCW019299 [Ixodes scapularis]|uniref:Secreted protein n=1 Tax=Ixodes scapularis TaxID=6945 RepID=B7PWR5_IXOSC|nr:hypothetical protein IscW_ISCW019299 [Ixodes scapularis]|eukprot:XP_002410212.1 hypothetical protein IscW_ISCW019299 [Ixodes scapularis]
MKVSVTLSILLAFIGGKSFSEASESNGTNPTAKFYERIQSFPIILYQCFRNGTVLETGHAIITSALWDGTSGNNDCAQATIWEIQNGTAGSSKNPFLASALGCAITGMVMLAGRLFKPATTRSPGWYL